jgi:soluble lytic murein transglycosylase-like protein
MKPKTVTLWLALMLPVGYAQAQETDARLRARLYEPLIASAAHRYNIDPRLLWTIAYLESRFRQGAISYKNGKPCAYGMMQFTTPTAARYGVKDPHNVGEAIDAAARYVRDLQERFGARGDLILAAYNAGEGTVESFRDGKRLVLSNKKIINPAGIRTGGVPPYLETREYVARGKLIYQNIGGERLFARRVSVPVAGSNDDAERKTTAEYERTEGSLYSSESGEKHPTEPALKSAKTKGSPQVGTSIYVN